MDVVHPFNNVELNRHRHGDLMDQHCLMLTRRDALAAPFGVVCTVTGIVTTDTSVIGAAAVTDDRRSSGYYESKHVMTYYAVNRV